MATEQITQPDQEVLKTVTDLALVKAAIEQLNIDLDLKNEFSELLDQRILEQISLMNNNSDGNHSEIDENKSEVDSDGSTRYYEICKEEKDPRGFWKHMLSHSPSNSKKKKKKYHKSPKKEPEELVKSSLTLIQLEKVDGEPDYVYCPYCEKPFHIQGVNSHISVIHGSKYTLEKGEPEFTEKFVQNVKIQNLEKKVEKEDEPTNLLKPVVVRLEDQSNGISVLEAEVLELINEYEEIDVDDLYEHASVSRDILVEAISKLYNLGLIERHEMSCDPGVYYTPKLR